MCHPGHCGEALCNAHTRLKESRERELAALIAPEVRQALERHSIELVNFADWGRARLVCPNCDTTATDKHGPTQIEKDWLMVVGNE